MPKLWRGKTQGSERLMGATGYGGKGFKERARVSGKRPIGPASRKQQHKQAACQNSHHYSVMYPHRGS